MCWYGVHELLQILVEIFENKVEFLLRVDYILQTRQERHGYQYTVTGK